MKQFVLKICAAFLVLCLMGMGLPLGYAAELVPANPRLVVALAEEQAEEEPFDEEAYMQEADADDEEEVVEPDEELQFIDELLSEIDMPENALDAVNGMTNILLIGIDARPKQKTGRSDTMILATLDSDHNCIKLTSFMRDLYVEIPGRKSNRLNAAYVFGGAELLKKTIKQNFGVNVDYYVTVNFSTLADVVDQLGGLTINVEKKYVPRVNAVIKMDNKVLGNKINSGLVSEPGEQLLTGRQTLAYARYRYGDPKGDAGRTVRQREVILKLLDKVKDMSLISLAKLALTNLDKVQTDMSLADMLRLAPAAFKLREGELKELRIPIDKSYSAQTIAGMSVYVPNRSKNKQALADFILGE